MKSIYPELALYEGKIEGARTDNAFYPISEVCDGTVSLGHQFSFKKTELILRPVFALISKALQTTEHIAIVMYITVFVY